MNQFYIFKRNKNGKRKLNKVTGLIFQDHLQVKQDSGTIRINAEFLLGNYLYGDILLVDFDEKTNKITPIEIPQIYADIEYSPAINESAKTYKDHLSIGIKDLQNCCDSLKNMTEQNQFIPQIMNKIKNTYSQYLNNRSEQLISSSKSIRSVNINLMSLNAQPITYPIRIITPIGQKKINAYVDSGAEFCLIDPELERKLKPKRTNEIISISGIEGGSIYAKVVILEIIIEEKYRTTIEAAIFPEIKRRFNSSVVIGQPTLNFANKMGVSIF